MATIIQDSLQEEQLDYTMKPIIRGDSRIITLVFTKKDENGENIPYTDGGYCIFTIKKSLGLLDNYALLRIKANVDTVTGICNITLQPNDTSNSISGNYYYDIQKVLIGEDLDNDPDTATIDSVKTVLMGRVKIIGDVGNSYKI